MMEYHVENKLNDGLLCHPYDVIIFEIGSRKTWFGH